MPQNVLTAAETNAQLDDDTLNPPQVNTNGRQVVHVTLVLDGVNWNPDLIFDALDAQYGTVAYEKNSVSRGAYIFNVAP